MNTSPSDDRTVRLVTQAYQSFLLLYPAGFREEYAQEMKEIFQARCMEIYQSSGIQGISRWLLKILAGEVISIYKEYLEMARDLFEHQRDARSTLALGTLFLAGTWIAFFFIASPAGRTSSFLPALMPGIALVLVNALLVARSLVRSERIEYVAGMAAMANMVLIAGLMAVQASLGVQPLVAFPLQILLIGLHGLLLWRLRGEEITQDLEKGK